MYLYMVWEVHTSLHLPLILCCPVSCQLDTSWRHCGEQQLRKYLYKICLWTSPWNIFLDWCLRVGGWESLWLLQPGLYKKANWGSHEEQPSKETLSNGHFTISYIMVIALSSCHDFVRRWTTRWKMKYIKFPQLTVVYSFLSQS